MRNLLIVVPLLLLTLSSCSISNWKLNGIPLSRFKEPTDIPLLIVGAGLSAGAHFCGHVLAFEVLDVDYSVSNGKEYFSPEGLSDSEIQWIGRSGFLSQLVLGTFLKFTPFEESTLTIGYNMFSCMQIISYPARNTFDDPVIQGDLYLIGAYGGNNRLEYYLYSTWSLGLLLINKEEIYGEQSRTNRDL